jgi:hypothetical protein
MSAVLDAFSWEVATVAALKLCPVSIMRCRWAAFTAQ